ncbi:membrane protein [Amylibacter marinus]|uniref:Membrane protein n=1 Tax=Amylibacter marinus TaxID=1475483 RepID=A0ABQ5VUE9_9RHOB|nr:MBL fold metallo-hydrolase [Amylibacter marinus]GLQ34882.1 membrane protein [Amylibacter marinus]
MQRRTFLKRLGLGTVGSALGALGYARYKQSFNGYYTGPVSDHYDGVRFFNPNGVEPGNLLDLLKWQFNTPRAKWPETFDSPYPQAKPPAQSDAIRVTMIGHASMLIQVAGVNILCDPVYSERVSPVGWAGPKRHNPVGIQFDDLPNIDLILISHNHYDHLDNLTLEKLVARDNPKIITPLGNDTIIHRRTPSADIAVGDWGDMIAHAGLKIHIEPCHHWSARGRNDRRMALWAAFVIEAGGQRIYHIGDTGFHSGINYGAAAEKFGGFDLAILPVGAYEPRWFMKGQHQNPAEAVQGMILCNAEYAIGHHWGTFQLTNEAVDAPPKALGEALARDTIPADRFVAMAPGQVWIR